jgi:hypothetical protein
MRTLDSFDFSDVCLLKVDAEGAEPLVFWGARELIRRFRPALLLERNAKTITDSMTATISVSEEVRHFRVEDFVSSLGYSGPVELGVDQLLLMPS